ncbi:glycine N-methyltransferase [Anthonomus grandis grandis]|uniref:glycine N-methyltransferase n=1 Tax=Anthonomus grandis grandis TaxID=2921223 RepID=UPI0021662044|nr:glycine N-methyltransferase [Anthonomus grandis grandis]
MAGNVITTRSLGAAVEGVKDQYADGKAAKVWELFIGDKNSRTQNYKNFLIGLLRERGCKRIMDVACGTGIDSVMLVEEGFEVVSVDASDKMLKYALKARWNRRKDPAFDRWVIEEANWLTLYDDIEDLVGEGFDAVICLGNSFAHLLDDFGDQREQKQALRNFEKCVKPGGILLIDHRNYDNIIDSGKTAIKSVYYNPTHTTDIKTSVLYVSGVPALVSLDYLIDSSSDKEKEQSDFISNEGCINEFRLSYYPHRLKVFKDMLKDAFGENSKYDIFGDFKRLDEIETPNFYIHLVEKYKTHF